MFSNHVYKTIILPTLVIRIPSLEIFLFCQHNSTGGGNLELGQTTYRVIHERGISEFFFTATHYTHCNNILISNFENNYN
jgi:hypothetical protein